MKETKWVLLLTFEMAFPEEKALELENYLKGGSKDAFLDFASQLLTFTSDNLSFKEHLDVLFSLVGFENFAFVYPIFTQISRFELVDRKPVTIISIYSSLMLFETFLKTDLGKKTQTNTEFKQNLFKAYLLLNSQLLKNKKTIDASTGKLNDQLRIPMRLFCADYFLNDKTNYHTIYVWMTQVFKAFFLFKFLESNKKSQRLLEGYLKRFNQQSWQGYLVNLLVLTIRNNELGEESVKTFEIPPGPNFKRDCEFFESLIVTDSDEFVQVDFKFLRARPFYKLKDGIYRIIFNLFVIEKIFKGVYFVMREVYKELEKAGYDDLPKNENDLRKFFTHEFSEKTLLYQVMGMIYPENSKRFSSEELQVDGSPDYYLRIGNKILLFESKDFLIPADIKASRDYNKYEVEFRKRLYYEIDSKGKRKNGAVLQLKNTISKILRKEFKADDLYDTESIHIYPILITHDAQYDVHGFNFLINYWFQAELETLKKDGLLTDKIRPLTVINIDCLIQHFDELNKHMALHEVLDEYHKHTDLHSLPEFNSDYEKIVYYSNKLNPFPEFLFDLFHSKNFLGNGLMDFTKQNLLPDFEILKKTP